MSLPSDIPPLDGTLGATEIGAILGTFLFGIETLQTFNYYRQYPNDNKLLKAAVAILWFLELGHTICVWHGLYTMTVTFYGQPGHLANPPRSLDVSIFFTAIILPLVQTFFASRIRALSGRWTITVICSLLTCLRFAFGISLLDIFWNSSGFSVLQSAGKARWTFMTVAALGPSVDIITAATLCYLLWNMRQSGAQFRQTRVMVDTLILWTVETTAITSLAGIMQLTLFLARNDLAWMPFYLIQPKLFSNSMLASLNSRQKLRSGKQDNVISLGSNDIRNRSVVVQMHRITETTGDLSSTNFPKEIGNTAGDVNGF
ncbi:hypothetical protein B0H11DRAFT_2060765 [Mycena galericulata]|nr:hypothetical protein B0H11DRAFT_2060765 [Mycena galericulata]